MYPYVCVVRSVNFSTQSIMSLAKNILLLVLDAYIVLTIWLQLRERMILFGWRKRQPNNVPYSFWLIRIYCLAPNKGSYLIICIVLNFINAFSGFLCLVGFILSIVTHEEHMAHNCLKFSVIIAAFFIVIVEFILRLISFSHRGK